MNREYKLSKRDFSDYIKELKVELKHCDKSNELLVNWYKKQIHYFKTKIKGI